MAETREPSYADLVHDVLRSAGRPLTFQEISERVNRRRPVTTRSPKATIRNALTQARQLISLGDGRYGYLPHLLQGSLLRLPLTEKKPANRPLIYPEEVRHALRPDFFEVRKRRLDRPVRVRLRNGDEVVLALEFFGNGIWGSPMPEGLRRYLVDKRAAAGDSLLIRVVDGEAGDCEAWFESRLNQDRAAVAGRNRELADTAYQLLRESRSRDVPTGRRGAGSGQGSVRARCRALLGCRRDTALHARVSGRPMRSGRWASGRERSSTCGTRPG